MAYAAYRELFGANRFHALHVEPPSLPKLMVLDLTVPSCDAFQVRRLLADCPHAGVLRCVPRPHDSLVRLEIQVPTDKVDEVIHLLMTRIPNGEMGVLRSWQSHLVTHGLTHGF